MKQLSCIFVMLASAIATDKLTKIANRLFRVQRGTMQPKNHTKVPLIAWPFWAIGQLVKTILSLTGRLLGVVIGFLLVVVGFLISLTVVGAVVGIPLAGLGILLVIRGLF